MQHDKTKWLDEALALVPSDIRRDADELLRPLLKRCNSKSRKTFWQWLRLTLAKDIETLGFLLYMQEHKLPPEVQETKAQGAEGFRYVTNNGTTLIEVIDGQDHAVWKVPTKRLDWALSLYPVHLKRLPPIESDERQEIRKKTRELKRQVKLMTPLQGQAFERDIAELEAAEAQRPKPPQRYMLMKYVGGEAVPVHRLFVDAEPEDQVEAIDNDFLNFSTTVIRLTASVVLQGGVAVVKGDYPLSYCEDTVIPNLQVLHSNESQKNFEKRMMKLKMTPWGNVDETPLRVQPNSTWHAGYFGGVVDAGEFKPLSKKDGDVIPIAYVGRKPEE